MTRRIPEQNSLFMTDLKSDLDRALGSKGEISRDLVLSWIDDARDVEALSKLYRLTGEGYSRIRPELGLDATCALIQRYFLECVRQDVKDNEQIQGRWEAAHTLHAWFCHLLENGGATSVLARAAHAITDLFLTSGQDVRNSIEQGFLEHALETAALRPYFESWASDPRLQDTWDRALAWGKAHPDHLGST
jgi:hypothetical protein